MPIERPDFDNLAERDLDELIEAQVPEGLRIEYKRATYGRADADRREALKDISSFANTGGGTLLIGVDAKAGIPIAKPGLPGVDIDQEVLRLENLARDGIEPRVIGLRTGTITLASGEQCIVLRIPRSWQAPHRVSAGSHNRFYLRNSAGVHEASVEELRTMFTQAAEATTRAKLFRGDRLSRIYSQRTELMLAQGGIAVLHIVPLAGVSGQVQVDLSAAGARWTEIAPLGASANDFRFNLDGLLTTRGAERLFGYCQLFRDGSIETTRANIVLEGNGKRFVQVRRLEAEVATTLPKLLNLLQTLAVPPPFVVMLSVHDVLKTVFRAIAPSFSGDPEPLNYEKTVVLPEVLVSEFGTPIDYHCSLRPIFDALWNIGGWPRAETFDANGNWNPQLVRE